VLQAAMDSRMLANVLMRVANAVSFFNLLSMDKDTLIKAPGAAANFIVLSSVL
jgi:hypothetical protein